MKKKNRRGSNYLARFATAVAEPPTYTDDIELFDAAIGNISAALDQGELSEEEAAALEANAIAELRQRLGGFIGVDDDEDDEYEEDDDELLDDDEVDYQSGTELATFSSGSLFGTAILELGDADGYESVEDVAAVMADNCGISDDEAIGLISGSILPGDYEDPEGLIDSVALIFSPSSSDQNVYNQLMQVGLSEGLAEEEIPETVQYTRELVNQNRQIQNLTAEFTQLQVEQVLRDEIAELQRDAMTGVEEGWLPPAAFSMMFGNEETEAGRIAAFSEVCSRNGVSEDVELYAMQKQLELMRRLGPVARFGAEVVEPLDPVEQQVDEVETRAARAYAKSLHSVLNIPSQ